ncbi:sensor histidine kinase [Neptunomonas antarctica]|uniref:histidine kinase n=1 Tax=Neptunomonas antarctica TaxID=619304 RepID=A0A1N7NCU8_9GAMM|nr:cache domain-containing protein [Neptunomonas antarctica]SIS96223.1 two-component system, NtrC family, sensor kinase [Neptunomonas antarctica]
MISAGWHKINSSLRNKLLLLTLAPLILTAIGFVMMTVYWTSSYTDRQLYMKVRADLAVAQGTLDIMQQQQLDALSQLASSYEFRTNLQWGNQRDIQIQLQETRKGRQLDFLRFLPTGLISDIKDPALASLLPRLYQGEPIKGLTVLNKKMLDRISADLEKQAHISLTKTPRAIPSNRIIEENAMLIRTLQPVNDEFGELIGILDSGRILNNTTQAVDTIRDLVYGPGTLPEGGIGTVTLFLDDVRISTNVPQNQHISYNKQMSLQERAIGTRVSAEVHQHVMTQGLTWINRAFVVNDWYISAYKPLVDLNNHRIGMIYAGFTEAPFNDIYYTTLFESGSLIGLIMLVSGFLILRHTRLLLNPLARIHSIVTAVRDDGSMQLRIGTLNTSDELVDLARQFDAMLDLLENREQEILQAHDQLEITVEKRTRSLRNRTEALKQHIRLLKTTRKKLLANEKLAVLGELTAGIAHEINNPAAVILGNIDLLVAELGDAAEPVQEEVDMVIRQVYRIRSLINNLLQYSRPDHYVDSYESYPIDQIIDDTLLLVSHALEKQQVNIDKFYTANCLVQVNYQQVQQVLVNLILNASHALTEPGSIQLHTADWFNETNQQGELNGELRAELKGVVIQVKDKGLGIKEEDLQHIFDPFFTTKKSGTGLGLSVSSGIIRRHGGDITVDSTPGEGTVFSVYLLRQANLSEDSELEAILDGLTATERTHRRSLASTPTS